jgi:uncharacterized SAM-binding protein YcdF (DUF218 family)
VTSTVESGPSTDAGGSDGGGGASSADGSSGDRRPWRRRRAFRLGRFAVRLGLALGFCALVYLSVTFVQVWDATRSDEARRADAIVVLGAAQYDCEPSPVLEQRLDHAKELYDDGVAPRIVVTGGKQAGDRCTEAQASAEYLMARGVPDRDLLREVKGRNSWESLAASTTILRDDGYTSAVLVTDGYHALRVEAIADELGLDAVVSPASGRASVRELIKETGVVAVGRVVGFRRLVNLDGHLVTSTT